MQHSVVLPDVGDAFGRYSFSNGALKVMNMASDRGFPMPGSSSTTTSRHDRQFRTLAESLPQIVWVASEECCFAYQNRRWCEYTGLSSDESTGFGWMQAFHPDDLLETLKRWQRAARGAKRANWLFVSGGATATTAGLRATWSRSLVRGRPEPSGRSQCATRAAIRRTPTNSATRSAALEEPDPRLLEKVLGNRADFHLRIRLAAGCSMEIVEPGHRRLPVTSLRRWGRSRCPLACIRPTYRGLDEHLAASIPPGTTTFWSSTTGCGTRTGAGVGSAAGTPFSIAQRQAGRLRLSEWPPILPSERIRNTLRSKNEDRHRALIAHASQTIWIADARGNVLEAGAWLETFTGDAGPIDRDGEWWLPHVHPDDRTLLRKARDQAIRHHERVAVQIRIRRHDGEFGWLALWGVPLFERDGTLREWVGTLQDITDQKHAAEAIIASEKHLRRVLDSLFTFVGVLTPDGTLIEANKAPLEAAGISPEDVLGKPIWDTYWFNHSPEVQEQLRAAVERANRGEPSRYDVDVRMAGGVPDDDRLHARPAAR